jgi:drug/metabolite transporter (DMT)-like permease
LEQSTTKDHLDLKGFLILVLLTLLWGCNYPAVKISNLGFSPIFNALLRSSIASVLGILYCLSIKEPLFHMDRRLFHGFVVGMLFGLEFVCIYLGMFYTDAARAGILINTSPFIVALGAYLFLRERLGILKIIGLALAFAGVCLVFQGKPKTSSSSMLFGDVLELGAAVLWGATTVYIKKYLAGRVHPIHTFLYQLVFSIPIIFLCSYLLEEKWILNVEYAPVVALLYASIVVAFASYLTWFKLIHTYPVSQLAVFTFLSPFFGVASGVVILGEQLTAGLVFGLLFVSAGIYLANYKKD